MAASLLSALRSFDPWHLDISRSARDADPSTRLVYRLLGPRGLATRFHLALLGKVEKLLLSLWRLRSSFRYQYSPWISALPAPGGHGSADGKKAFAAHQK